jgi:hypothetical protein
MDCVCVVVVVVGLDGGGGGLEWEGRETHAGEVMIDRSVDSYIHTPPTHPPTHPQALALGRICPYQPLPTHPHYQKTQTPTHPRSPTLSPLHQPGP